MTQPLTPVFRAPAPSSTRFDTASLDTVSTDQGGELASGSQRGELPASPTPPQPGPCGSWSTEIRTSCRRQHRPGPAGRVQPMAGPA